MSYLPPFGPPFGPPGPPGPGPGPTPGPPGGQPMAPTSPPPSFVPQQQSASLLTVDPGGIRRCMFRFTYIWLHHGGQFWFFPVFVGPNSIAGFRWTGFSWIYTGFDLRSIQSFTCV
ncbi:collagen-like protein [Paenibacillus paeoniae]|uniref:collagen-like protein n=1 Tax=Paenibacillus paeoniae TaxID=2292705 RepID=UPI001058680C|nr:collagen-like protein [Paenibacillus paeoniae]